MNKMYISNQINDWLMPKHLNGSEANVDDYSFDYGDSHFIHINSMEPARQVYWATMLRGFTSDQIEWIEDDYDNAIDNSKKHTFLFTHAPIVKDSTFMDWTHKSPNDYEFIKSTEVNFMLFDAIFSGHTHEQDFNYGVRTSVLDNTPDDNNLFWYNDKKIAENTNGYKWSNGNPTGFFETGKCT